MTNDSQNGSLPDHTPDRPFECTECHRPISVIYTEIVGNTMTHTGMCAECPILRLRLFGTPHVEFSSNKNVAETGLACANCGTTLDAIRLGSPLGCGECYKVFDDVLLPEMLAAHTIPQRVATNKKSIPVHIGRTPGEIQEISPSLRLLALNEALNEMLKTEDYEQAAWLRDQIKALTEKTESSNEGKK